MDINLINILKRILINYYKYNQYIDGSIFIENAGDVQVGDMVRVKILQGFTYEMVAELI